MTNISFTVSNRACPDFNPVFDRNSISVPGNYVILPGFCDVHVHLREPGFCYKETVETGSLAAARGGYTVVCPMPNLNPVPDSREHLEEELEAIRRAGIIRVIPYGAVSVGEQGERLSELEAMAGDVIAFSDDGRGIQSEELMLEAMERAKALGKIIAAHCEDNTLVRGGYIHDGRYAREHGHRGICSESEWVQVARDVSLAERTGCAYHVCHVSTKESVEIIRKAKARGVNVSCETAPHYLLLSEDDLCEDGRFKMNPPLRSPEDRAALTEGIKDGTVDMIATDHAPHSAEEKSKGLEGSAMGITGLECAFPMLYTGLVKTGIISLDRLIELIAVNPRKRFGIELSNDDYTVWNLEEETTVNPDDFLSKGKSTPFAGQRVFGKCYLTVCGGKTAYKYEV